MKWQDLRKSENVEDVRGSGRRTSPAVVGGGIGLGAIFIALIGSVLFGLDPTTILSGMQGGSAGAAPGGQVEEAPVNDQESEFVKKILGDTEDTWNAIFQKQMGSRYPAPKLVLFSGQTRSGCGAAQQQMGPFYCPVDQKVYLDMGFFRQIQAAAGEHADFARAYAIAHEVGHHIQNVIGVMDKVNAQRQNADEETSNALSVRVELQADCFAGVWGHFTAQKGVLDKQDLTAALNTAAQIGDDYLQKQSRGYSSPETWTHGSSQQRVKWFTVGLKGGDINQCNTFIANP